MQEYVVVELLFETLDRTSLQNSFSDAWSGDAPEAARAGMQSSRSKDFMDG